MSHSPSPAATAPAPDRLHFLDGLRALAALWVMFGHMHLFALGWHPTSMPAGLLLNVLMYLHLGVDVFLVLSGFCLALPAVRQDYRLSFGLRRFFAARAVRILPPYLATLGLILLVNWFVPLAQWGRHPLGLTTTITLHELLANLLLLQDIFPQFNTINGPFWSIACEWHLYFLFPLALWLLRRFGALALLIAGANLGFFLTWLSFLAPTPIPGLPVFVPQPPHFVALFAMGIAAAAFAYGSQFAAMRAQIYRSAWLVAAGLLLPLLLLLWDFRIVDGDTAVRLSNHVHLIDPLCGAVAAALLVGLCGLTPAHWGRRLLERRWLVALGGFSYSLYLTHIPLLAAMNKGLEQNGHPYLIFAILATGGSVACIGFAWGFSKLFERRLRSPRTSAVSSGAAVPQTHHQA